MNKKLKITFSILIFLITLEFLLFVTGSKPGVFYKLKGFELNNIEDRTSIYSNDNHGIFRIDPIIHEFLNNLDNEELKKNYDQIKRLDGLERIIDDFKDLINIKKTSAKSNSEFEKRVLKIDSNGCFDQILLKYIKTPINENGFRSITFEKTDCKKPKIMLIGDSFVWGMSATPIYNSFSDILLSRGYLVYNFGIPGTDPAQYEAILKKYLSIIDPDLVVVVFFPGNDFMTYKREIKENEPLEHYTQIGFIESNPLGEYLSPKEAIEFYSSINQIPKNSIFNVLCSKSNVSTKFWLLLNELCIVKHPNRDLYFKNKNKSNYEKAKTTLPYIENIRNYCTIHNTKILEVIIPEKKMMLSNKKAFGENILNRKELEIIFGKNLLFPKNLSNIDYEESGGVHFDNNGSLKFANFLDSLIQIKLEN
jgi:hypothetical protein